MKNTTFTSCLAGLSSCALLVSFGLFGIATSTLSNDAVSAFNGKIEGTYGEVNDTYSRGIAGSLSIPVAESWGIQFDSLYQHAAEDDYYGLGAHFFTRKSETGLLGVVAGGIHSGTIGNFAVAIEGEYYLSWLTIGGFAGYDNVQSNGTMVTYSPKVTNRDDFAIVNLYLAAYPTENLMLRFDYMNRIDKNFYDFQVEYQTPVPGLSAFGIVGFGDNDFFQILGGVRYYIGKDKTLKARHRQDDPTNILNNMQGTNQAGGQDPGNGSSSTGERIRG
ncbi:MAG: hypothetical protein ACO1TE_25195 [Prosthecobacter sp.]